MTWTPKARMRQREHSGSPPTRSRRRNDPLLDRRGRLERSLFRVVLSLVVLVFVPGLLEAFESPKSALLVAAGSGWLTIFILSGAAWRERGLEGVAQKMDASVVSWVIIVAAATALGVSPRLSLHGEIAQREGLIVTLALAGAYTAIRRTHRGPPHARATLDAFLASMAVAAAYALAQFLGLDPLAGMHRFTYQDVARAVTRPSSTFGNPNLLGALLAPALGIVVSRLANGAGSFTRLVLLGALLSVVIVATLSRGAWLAAVVAAASGLAGARLFSARAGWRRTIVAAAVAAVPAGLFALLALRGPLVARIAETAQPEAASTSGRLEIARSAMALWREHLLTGIGPNAFGLMFPSVQTVKFWANGWQGVAANAHSAPLQLLVSLGLLGVGAGCVWLVSLTMLAKRRLVGPGPERGSSLDIIAAIAGLTTAGAVNPLGTAGALLFVTLCALLVASQSPTCESVPPDNHSGRILGLSGLAITLLVAAALLVQLRAHAEGGRARGYFHLSAAAEGATRARALEQASLLVSHAVRLAPREEELLRLGADIELARTRSAEGMADSTLVIASLEAARSFAEAACTLEPLRASSVQRLGNAWAAAARTATDPAERDRAMDRADSCFAVAARLAPLDAFIAVDEVRANLELGRPEAALRSARRIVTLYPQAAIGHSLEAAALLARDRPDSAVVSLRRALVSRWEEGEESERRAAEAYLHRLEAAVPPSGRVQVGMGRKDY